MPALSKSFSERNPVTIGVVGIITVAVIVVGSLSAARLTRAFTETKYRAEFTDAGGLRVGDQVRVSGLDLGTVEGLDIEDRRVVVSFSLESDVSLGDATRADIKSATVLGRKYLQLTPAGTGSMNAGGTIPVKRTQAPYDVQERLEGLGKELRPLDRKQLASAMDTVSEAMAGTPDDLHAALSSVREAAAVINQRDEALLTLLDSAANVTSLLATRSGEVTTLVRDANSLLSELYARRQALRALLVNVNALVEQLHGLAVDNKARIGTALRELDGVTTLLNNNEKNVTAAIEGLRNYVGSLGEAVNAGPWFYGYIANLVSPNLSQQTTESVLKELTSAGVATP